MTPSQKNEKALAALQDTLAFTNKCLDAEVFRDAGVVVKVGIEKAIATLSQPTTGEGEYLTWKSAFDAGRTFQKQLDNRRDVHIPVSGPGHCWNCGTDIMPSDQDAGTWKEHFCCAEHETDFEPTPLGGEVVTVEDAKDLIWREIAKQSTNHMSRGHYEWILNAVVRTPFILALIQSRVGGR